MTVESLSLGSLPILCVLRLIVLLNNFCWNVCLSCHRCITCVFHGARISDRDYRTFDR